MDYDEFFPILTSGKKLYASREGLLYIRALGKTEQGSESCKASIGPCAVLVFCSNNASIHEELFVTESLLKDLLEGPHPFVDTGMGRWVPADNIECFDSKVGRTAGRIHPCEDWHPYAKRSWVKLNSGRWLPSVKTLSELEAEMAAAYEKALSFRSQKGLAKSFETATPQNGPQLPAI